MIIVVRDEIYGRNFHIVIDESLAEFIDNLKNMHGDQLDEVKRLEKILVGSRGATIFTMKPYKYVWIKDFDPAIDDHQSVLIHELSHFMDFALSDVGIPTGISNTEVRAYYLQYIYKQSIQAIKAELANAKTGTGDKRSQYDKTKKQAKKNSEKHERSKKATA